MWRYDLAICPAWDKKLPAITLPPPLLCLQEHSTSSSGFTPPSPDKPLDIPKELWLLMDKLQREGRQVEDLFEQPGLHTEVQTIRDALDTGQNIIRILFGKKSGFNIL